MRQSASFGRACGDEQDLPPGQPLREHALLFDPGGPNAPRPLTTHSVLPSVRLTTSAPRSVIFRGSNHTACSLAVYASRLGLLRSHHARLAYRWRPTLAGQDLNLLDCFRRFLCNVTSHHFDPPSPSFAWRTNGRDTARAGGWLSRCTCHARGEVGGRCVKGGLWTDQKSIPRHRGRPCINVGRCSLLNIHVIRDDFTLPASLREVIERRNR